MLTQLDIHIFILRDQSTSSCDLAACQTQPSEHPLRTTFVTLEPLIHWGTITPVTSVSLRRGGVQAFRRDGEMCDDPLWTQAIKRFTPECPTSYCVECFELLVAKRTTISPVAAQREAHTFTAINSRPGYVRHSRVRQVENDFEDDTDHEVLPKHIVDVARAVVSKNERQSSNDSTNGNATMVCA